jgi:hypothetical protein
MSNLCKIDMSLFYLNSLYNMTHFEPLSMMVQLLCQNLIRILKYLFYKVSLYNTSY